jgi:hypothetical protein
LVVDDPKYVPALKLMLETIRGKVSVDGCEASVEVEDADFHLTYDLLGFGYLPNETDDDVLFVLNQDLYDDIADKGRSILDPARRGGWRTVLDRFGIEEPSILKDCF